MKIIGLTGGIGSGKSTVARFLSALGAAVIDADRVGHEALKPRGAAWQQVVAAFGKEVVTTNGTIDRKRLGRIIFGDDAARNSLNRIMHPIINQMVQARLEKLRRRGTAVAVLEAPLLVEGGWVSLVDEVWVTTAPEATILQRLRERAGLSERESLARISSQMPSEDREKYADVIIGTDCSLGELEARVKRLFDRHRR